MIVPVETRQVPLADCAAEIDEYLSQVAAAETPVFAIVDRWETHAKALTALQPHLAISGLSTTGEKPSPFIHESAAGVRRHIGVSLRGRVSYLGYTGLHTDLKPDRKTPPFSWANIHTTEVGETEARFYEPAEAYVAKFLARPAMRRLMSTDYQLTLPNKVYDQLKENVVDDEVLVPIRHNITARLGTTIIFRAYGRRPVFNGFRDTVLPRVSKLSSASPI